MGRLKLSIGWDEESRDLGRAELGVEKDQRIVDTDAEVDSGGRVDGRAIRGASLCP